MSGVHGFDPNFKARKEVEILRKNGLIDEQKKQTVSAKDGETTTSQVNNVMALLEQANAVGPNEVVNSTTEFDDRANVKELDLKYGDNIVYDNSDINIPEFLDYMTEGKDLDAGELAELLTRFVNEILLNPQYGKVTISSVTQIIDYINELPSETSLELSALPVSVIDYLLNGGVKGASSQATYGDIKNIVNKIIEEIIAKRPPVEPPVEPDPVDPLEELFNQNKFSNNLFTKAYIDTIRDEFCLGEEETVKICGKLNTIISTMVDEIGKENIDFETAKQIVYNAMYGRWPLKSEVADVIKNTPNGASLNDAEIMEIVNSLSADIYKACNSAYINQTGDKTLLTAQEKLDVITQVLQTKRPDLYGVQEPEPDPVVIDTPEKALEALQAKMSEVANGVLKVEDIEEYLAQFKSEASLYIQMKFGYDEGYADLLAMFIANATREAFKSKTKINSIDVGLKFCTLLQNQDFSFLDTSNDRFMGAIQRGLNIIDENWITRIEVARTSDGYKLYGGEWINNDNDLVYNQDGSINQGVFFTFMTDYLRDTVFGGKLNESELKVLYEKILKKFAGSNYKDGKVALNPNSNNTTNYVNGKYDKDHDGSWFNDFFRAMMEVASEVNVINLDEIKDEDVNLDALFGGKSSISTSDIHNNEKTYLLSNDPTVRLIFGELINASDEYNITTNADYFDFLNIFVQMINNEVDVADTLDNSGNQILTREALEKYLEKHSIQELKDFIQGTELRNAYFESTFKINGEIEGFYQALSGDCWLLSGLMALNASPEGKEIIKHAISSYVGEDSQTYYTVTFQGGYNKYGSWTQEIITSTFSQAELFDLMATGKYSKIQKSEDGTFDWDLFLFEAAVADLREKQKMNTYLGFAQFFGTDGDPYLFMGSQDELISYLTGIDLGYRPGAERKEDTTYYGVTKEYRQGLHQLVNDLMAQGLIDPVDGTIHNYAFYFSKNGHALAITRIIGDKIYFIDPNDSTKEYYTTWSSFESGTITYYDAKTGTKVGTLTIKEAGFAGPLDETPVWQALQEQE